MILRLQFVSYIRIFWPLSRDISTNGTSFPFGRFEKKHNLIFQIDLFRKRRNSQMAAVLLQMIPSFYTNFSQNTMFVFANTYKNYSMSEKDCIVLHDDKVCFLPNCRYHIILIGDIKELLQKLDAFSFNYQHVDCLYTVFRYRFSGKIFVKSGQRFDIVQKAVHFNHQSNGVDRKSSIAKKRLLRKKHKIHFLKFF